MDEMEISNNDEEMSNDLQDHMDKVYVVGLELMSRAAKSPDCPGQPERLQGVLRVLISLELASYPQAQEEWMCRVDKIVDVARFGQNAQIWSDLGNAQQGAKRTLMHLYLHLLPSPPTQVSFFFLHD